MSETREEIDARIEKAMEREFGPSLAAIRRQFLSLSGSKMAIAIRELDELQRVRDMANGIISRRRAKVSPRPSAVVASAVEST